MTGAMYAAIAGLRTHMQNLNVIGNNVANVNTYGYKSARSVFATSLYTTLSGGSDGSASLGGANPSQIGYGSTMSSIGIDMSTGNYAVTGRPMDMMLDGDGFFIMGSKDTALQFKGDGTDSDILDGMNLTRVGNFWFGPDGYMAKENDGMCVYGFQCVGKDPITGDAVFSDQLVPIRLPGVKTNKDGTRELVYPAPATETDVTNSKGALKKGYLADQLQEVDDGKGNTVYQAYPSTTLEAITVDKNTGIITGKSKDTGELVTVGIIGVGVVKSPDGVTNLGDNYYYAGKGSGGLTVSLLGNSGENLKWGTVTVDDTGKATADYNSGKDAAFMNQSLLGDQAPDTADKISDVCRLRDGGETRVLQSGLEMSKTDLAQEISQMILTQRGYQANTRIVTVTDSMLEELVNMKR